MLGSFIFAGAYIVILASFSTGLNLDYFAAYARAFGQGSLSLAMPSVGTFLLILTLPGAAIIYASYSLRLSKGPQVVLPGLVAIFAGVMTLGSFAYYVGRSSSSGQLQALLPFFSLALVATIAMIGLPNTKPDVNNPQLLAGILAASLPAFAIASILQAPDPRAQWGKVVPSATTSFLNAGLELPNTVAEALQATPQTMDASVTIAVDNGNIAAAVTGVKSQSPLNYLADAGLSEALEHSLCKALRSSSLPLLLPSSSRDFVTSTCELPFNLVQLNEEFLLAVRR